MAKVARMIAAAGALAGGYMQGKKMQEDAEWEKEKRQLERDAAQREADARQAAASTLGQVGTTSGAAVSGEEAAAAGAQAQADALARATTDQERAAVQQDYAPTMAALASQRGTAATPGATYTQDQAQGDFVKKMYAIDPSKAAQAEATQLTIDEGRDKAETRKKLKAVDTALRTWGEKAIPKDDQGQPMINDGTMVNMTKMRTLLLSQQGLYDQAMATAKDGMQYATAKIQADSVQRQAATRDAVAAAGMGDFSKALEVYKQFVPDGADPTGIKPGKDGSLVMTRTSALDGAPLPAITFKNMDHFMASLNALADGNALTAYVERTFKHDIESRKVGIEGGKLGVAQAAETRAKGKDDRETSKLDAVSKGLADYAEAESRGDEKGMSAARRAVLANGGKLDKPEVVKPEVKVGNMGDITVSQPTGKGGVQITNYGPDMKAKGAVAVGAPGAGAAVQTPKTKADFEKLPKGAIYIDPEDGKRYRKP